MAAATHQIPAILANLRGEATRVPPVWIMRQAGRYLPEYRALREKYSGFQQLYLNSELACEISLLPLQRFELAAAIVFSDILIALEGLGIKVSFAEVGGSRPGRGPVIAKPIRSSADLRSLPATTDLSNYDFLATAIRLCKAALPKDKALIGFVGSPWTLAAYAVEGYNTKNFSQLRSLMYTEPITLQRLLQRLSMEVAELALLQIQSGADVIQIFDSWAGLLGAAKYREFSYKYLAEVVAVLKRRAPATPVILYAKGAPLSPLEMIECAPQGLGLDWQTELSAAFHQTGGRVCLQGNLDPAALYAEPAVLGAEIAKLLSARPPTSPYIFNLGHGIYPDILPDRVAYLVDKVHSWQP